MSQINGEPSPRIAASPLAACLSVQLVDRDGSTATARLRCPADFPGFAGHFPEQPVLPAVLQLLAVRLLSESVLATPLQPVAVERLKFKGMVGPEDAVSLQVCLHEQDGLVKSEFRLDREGTPVASGTLIFRRPGWEEC